MDPASAVSAGSPPASSASGRHSRSRGPRRERPIATRLWPSACGRRGPTPPSAAASGALGSFVGPPGPACAMQRDRCVTRRPGLQGGRDPVRRESTWAAKEARPLATRATWAAKGARPLATRATWAAKEARPLATRATWAARGAGPVASRVELGCNGGRIPCVASRMAMQGRRGPLRCKSEGTARGRDPLAVQVDYRARESRPLAAQVDYRASNRKHWREVRASCSGRRRGSPVQQSHDAPSGVAVTDRHGDAF